jgi:hypothetical protein
MSSLACASLKKKRLKVWILFSTKSGVILFNRIGRDVKPLIKTCGESNTPQVVFSFLCGAKECLPAAKRPATRMIAWDSWEEVWHLPDAERPSRHSFAPRGNESSLSGALSLPDGVCNQFGTKFETKKKSRIRF